MKIGIITYTCAQNWGAVLQAYSLNSYINCLGYDSELIDYRKFDSRLFKPRKCIKDILLSLILYKENKERIEAFEKFRKEYFKLTSYTYEDTKSLEKTNDIFDIFITGSDQMWNCETEICYDFYLDFVKNNKYKISYAPSFGKDSIPEKFEEEVTRLLNRYDKMSVREKSGSQIVKKLIGKDIPVVLDPVFLKSDKEWEELIPNITLNKKYIFIYQTQISQKVKSLIKQYLKNNPECIVITPYAIPGIKAIVKKNIGPKEFLYYIKNAKYVIGTSFHAVAFSLIFKKDFCVVPHSSTGARVRDLLKDLNLNEQIVENEKGYTFPKLKKEKYINILNEKINFSKEYLKSVLENYCK